MPSQYSAQRQGEIPLKDEDRVTDRPVPSNNHPDSPGMGASERLLSWILAGFILLALAWAYVNVDNRVRTARSDKQQVIERQLNAISNSHSKLERQLSLNDHLSEYALDEAENELEIARETRDSARERYRTELDAGTNSAKLKLAYLRQERLVAKAESELKILKRERSEATAELREFDDSNAAKQRVAEKQLESNQRTDARIIFVLRALLAFGILALSLVIMRRVAERSPRLLPLAQAAVGASGLLALSMIIDYSEVSFDFESVGPLGLSFLGMLLTIGGFFALQRYLRKRRPAKRLRAGECRSCGYPAGKGDFCEGCGDQLLAPCEHCGAARRVGTAHCRACGRG